MLNVLLTIHMIACVALVIAVMLQRSEGGALGMGGGGTGGLISGRGAASVLVRTTMGLAFVFFVTSITMTRLNNDAANSGSILEQQLDQTTTPFDTLGTTTPGATTTTPDPLTGTTPAPAPAPAAPSTSPDPLAPAANTAPAPAATPPATTAPTTPAPTPENGGSPN